MTDPLAPLLAAMADRVAAVVLAERLRRDVGSQAVLYDGVVLRFTCSFGVAERSATMERLGHLLGAADKALYRAKALGRDRVERDG